ncbi:MAG: CoA transferase [Burkholderiaceae bacterium]|nr:CoA transferase [Burkholderiaceae bacterium]
MAVSASNTVAGPLAGVTILDLTSVLLGPFATLQLADMGADVIKVESPEGDVMRYAGPSRHRGMSPIFLNVNRNKRSIVLDLKQDEDRHSLLALARRADVFVHNMRPHAIRLLDLGYEALRAVNPRIIHCTAIGFGRGGRYGDDAAYDDVVQGASGLAASQAHLAGEPQYVASAICDKSGGMAAALAISAALFARERSGVGQEIEVPMYEVMVANVTAEHLYGATFEPPLGPAVYPRQTSRHRRPYRTQDGYISVMVYTDKQWAEFFRLIGREDLIGSPRFDSITSRTENIDEAYSMVADAVAQKTSAQWLASFKQASIPACPVNTVQDLMSDPHLSDVAMFNEVEHPSEGRIRQVKSPFFFSATPVVTRRLAPRLGEHTVEVLAEFGVPTGGDGAHG